MSTSIKIAIASSEDNLVWVFTTVGKMTRNNSSIIILEVARLSAERTFEMGKKWLRDLSQIEEKASNKVFYLQNISYIIHSTLFQAVSKNCLNKLFEIDIL